MPNLNIHIEVFLMKDFLNMCDIICLAESVVTQT